MARRKRSRVKVPLKLERMYKRILESLLDRGRSLKVAERIAAATVNKRRARLARVRRGPRLVSRGGSRRQWYPGKRRGREKFACLEHGRRFKTKAALRAHYRSH